MEVLVAPPRPPAVALVPRQIIIIISTKLGKRDKDHENTTAPILNTLLGVSAGCRSSVHVHLAYFSSVPLRNKTGGLCTPWQDALLARHMQIWASCCDMRAGTRINPHVQGTVWHLRSRNSEGVLIVVCKRVSWRSSPFRWCFGRFGSRRECYDCWWYSTCTLCVRSASRQLGLDRISVITSYYLVIADSNPSVYVVPFMKSVYSIYLQHGIRAPRCN